MIKNLLVGVCGGVLECAGVCLGEFGCVGVCLCVWECWGAYCNVFGCVLVLKCACVGVCYNEFACVWWGHTRIEKPGRERLVRSRPLLTTTYDLPSPVYKFIPSIRLKLPFVAPLTSRPLHLFHFSTVPLVTMSSFIHLVPAAARCNVFVPVAICNQPTKKKLRHSTDPLVRTISPRLITAGSVSRWMEGREMMGK